MAEPTLASILMGQGYKPDLGTDSDFSPTTADILRRQDAMYSGPGGALRSLGDWIPKVEADDTSNTSAILSRLGRTGTSIAKGGLNTMANWLQGSPEIGPDTLAPLGAVGVGAAFSGPKLARMQRARDMGFDTDRTLYHGTPETEHFAAFDLTTNPGANFYGEGVYTTPSKKDAQHYTGEEGHVRDLYSAAKKAFNIDYDNFDDAVRRAAEIYPDYPLTRSGFPFKPEIQGWTDALKRHGYDAVEVTGRGVDPERVDLYPHNMRDVKAKFDPSQSHSANLLASDATRSSVPGTVLNAQEERRPSMADILIGLR